MIPGVYTECHDVTLVQYLPMCAAQLKQTLITEYDNVVKQLLLTNLEESEYQSNHACAVQKKSHLVQVTDQGNPACHRRRAFVQRTRQEQQHKDQIQQVRRMGRHVDWVLYTNVTNHVYVSLCS